MLTPACKNKILIIRVCCTDNFLSSIHSVKPWPFYISDQWGKVRGKNATLCAYIPFRTFFCCFPWKKMCFFHFHDFLWWSIKLLQQNINLSETGIGDKKLSVELCDNSQKLRISRSQSFFFLLSNFAWFLYFNPLIFSATVYPQ